ncbi:MULTISPECIES: hypothetical protein [unclassified Rhodococcus (in: high G+C Gram-positive bacteria)]|uniref:hypothetical protein n=1 Tax=unclassified Rhodococcus (in: high G+C Gram-positive bacteria) TaxID=192944 RepID=UPI000B9AB228|nr:MULTISPECIES: hypothetical protein [unclassified Rhodococcus (in: high G+C Gram-positive bacteria)]OZE35624.1 hypothetical protein CH259_16490 [Rhodococcus sp. 05-2254-4]OZE48053.1 hypothetical protein CH261_09085 [Rhodococcus sp. 05-2254-3]OZE49264.1 hypothetical protein CH283_16870 [Rhodococcus sp. 05-2254-2]
MSDRAYEIHMEEVRIRQRAVKDGRGLSRMERSHLAKLAAEAKELAEKLEAERAARYKPSTGYHLPTPTDPVRRRNVGDWGPDA